VVSVAPFHMVNSAYIKVTNYSLKLIQKLQILIKILTFIRPLRPFIKTIKTTMEPRGKPRRITALSMLKLFIPFSSEDTYFSFPGS